MSLSADATCPLARLAFDGQRTYKQHGPKLGVNRDTAEGPSLATKRISPHALRYAKAMDMHLLRSGVPFNAIQPPRCLRRLQRLTRWSHEQVDPALA
jgi:hypothetical protein